MKKSAKKRRRKKNVQPFLTVLLFIAIIIILFFVAKSSLFNIKAIAVKGNSHFTNDEIIEKSGVEIGLNIFFNFNKKNAINNLLKSPYIKSAAIERSLPSGLVIIIEERVETAAVSFGEDYVILDQEGIILTLSSDSKQLPVILGFTIIGGSEGIKIEADDSEKFSDCLNLIKKANDLDLYFELVDFSSGNIKTYIYFDRYYCVGTYENIYASLDKIKMLIATQYKEKISKGVIYVGSEGYLSFAP